MNQQPPTDYKQQFEQAQQTISMLQHELAMLKKMIFGSRQEKFVAATSNPSQLALDMQADQLMTSRVTEAKRVSYVRSKVETTVNQHPGRHKLPEHLRREEIILEPNNIPPGSKKIGELETEVLEYKEAELFVKRYIRSKYLLPASGDGTESEIISADLPSAPVPKCIAGPGLLSQIIIDKYVDHLPLHRQMQRFERAGIKLPYSTLTDWVSATSKLITPLYASLKELVLDSRYIQCDEMR